MTPEEDALLHGEPGQFIYWWTHLTDDERSAIPEGFLRYRQVFPHPGATIDRFSRQSKNPGGNGKGGDHEDAETEPQNLRADPLNWPQLLTRGEPPVRQWAINGWIGFGHITLLIGLGGIGKTLIAQQAASALALGKPNFIGEIPRPLTVMMWACEDDHDELWRRQLQIAAWQGVDIGAYTERLILVPRVGMENVLFAKVYDHTFVTPLMDELREQAQDYRADVVILDNAAQVYGGNPHDQHQVTFFLNKLVGNLVGRAIPLLGHPSRALGSELFGSGAWENCARTRLYLADKLPDQGGKDEEPDPNNTTRFLARRKANYSSKDYRRFTYQEGVLIQDEIEESGGMIDHLRRQRSQSVVIDGLLRLQTMTVRAVDSANSPAFLPRLIIEYNLADGRTRRELADAMRQLMLDGKLKRVVIGLDSSRHQLFGLVVSP